MFISKFLFYKYEIFFFSIEMDFFYFDEDLKTWDSLAFKSSAVKAF